MHKQVKGESGGSITGECKNNRGKRVEDGLVGLADDGEHPQILNLGKRTQFIMQHK